jgi:hypothetical protein
MAAYGMFRQTNGNAQMGTLGVPTLRIAAQTAIAVSSCCIDAQRFPVAVTQ